MDVRERLLDDLVELFKPFVLRMVEEEVERLLTSSIEPERIEEWMRLVEGSGAGRIVKAVGLRHLRKKMKAAQAGKELSLSVLERKFLHEQAAKHLPRYVVRSWLGTMTNHGTKADGSLGQRVVTNLDDAMLPSGITAIDIDPRMRAFGIDDARMRELLKRVHDSLGGKSLPDAAAAWLEEQDITVE